MVHSVPGRPKVLGAVTLLVFAGACATLAQPSLPPSIAYSLPRTLKVQVRHGGSSAVVTVPIEDYVAATILSEVDPPDADTKVLEHMFEVQAVLTRTYAISHRGRHADQGFDVCDTTHCQLYEPDRLRWSKWSALARERPRGRPAKSSGSAAPRHAPSTTPIAGDTRAPAARSGGATPSAYLPSAADDGPARGSHMTWTFEASRAELRDALNADPRTRCRTRAESHRPRRHRLRPARRDRDDPSALRAVEVRGISSATCSPAHSESEACAARCSRSRERAIRSSSPGAGSATASACARPARWPASTPARVRQPCSRTISRGRRFRWRNGVVWPLGEPDPEPRTPNARTTRNNKRHPVIA